jgi:hypothetical protein
LFGVDGHIVELKAAVGAVWKRVLFLYKVEKVDSKSIGV